MHPKNPLVPFLFLVILFTLGSCHYKLNLLPGLYKSTQRNSIKRYISKHPEMNATLGETDSTMTLSLRNPKISSTDFVYYFNKKDKAYRKDICIKCDSCVMIYWNKILNNRLYNWNKINSRFYISKFSKKRTLQLLSGSSYNSVIRIQKVKWKKKEYARFLNSAN